MKEPIKIIKKEIVEISRGDKKLIELVRIAGEIIIREDKELLKELAKH
tara:strand:- start:2902 stop:3045 length:144 start_codon:yes stop_codon:yes gene_type:complete